MGEIDYANHRDVILLLEDDENDVTFFRRALKKSGAPFSLVVLKNGAEAVQYFQRTWPFADPQSPPCPKLLITDLKMPQMGGLEFLAWLQSKRIRVFPTLVLSSAQEEKEVAEAYRLGIQAYLVKPLRHELYLEMVATMIGFWRFSVRPPGTAH